MAVFCYHGDEGLTFGTIIEQRIMSEQRFKERKDELREVVLRLEEAALLPDNDVKGIIPDEKEADIWLKMLEDRNLTTHTYHEELANDIYQKIKRIYAKYLRVMNDRIQKITWS